jgi:hypothetical protein
MIQAIICSAWSTFYMTEIVSHYWYAKYTEYRCIHFHFLTIWKLLQQMLRTWIDDHSLQKMQTYWWTTGWIYVKLICNMHKQQRRQEINPLAPMGVLARGSAHARPSTRPPIDTHVCRVTFKHLPEPLGSYIWSFGTLGQLLEIPPFFRPIIA